MRRRAFIVALGGVAAWPLMVRGQGNKIWRVAYLSPAGGAMGVALFNVFTDKMQDLGYVLGKNLLIERRSAEGDYSRLPALALELVSLAPDVIVGANSAATAALQHSTSSIPIVMGTTGDPIGDGLIKSFAKPGGNITGMSSQSAELSSKALELLHIAIPNAKRIGVLTSPAPQHKLMLKDVYAAAEPLRLEIVPRLRREHLPISTRLLQQCTKKTVMRF